MESNSYNQLGDTAIRDALKNVCHFVPCKNKESLPVYIGHQGEEFKLQLYEPFDLYNQRLLPTGPLFVQVKIGFIPGPLIEFYVHDERIHKPTWKQVANTIINKGGWDLCVWKFEGEVLVCDKVNMREKIGVAFEYGPGGRSYRETSPCTYWQDLARDSANRPSPRTYSVKARFYKLPSTSLITLYITWRDGFPEEQFGQCLQILRQKKLGKAADSLLDFQPIGPHSADSATPVIGGRQLTLLGASFVDLYRLYTDSEDLVKHLHINDPYPPLNEKQIAAAIDDLQPTEQQLWNEFNREFDRLLFQGNKYTEEQASTQWQAYKANVNKPNPETHLMFGPPVMEKTRGINQKTLMYGFSAPNVAEGFGWNKNRYYSETNRLNHRAEWLHRSAFSLVGPDSQHAHNLIFGSVEANTLMMRYEDTVKRVIRRLHDHYTAERQLSDGTQTNLYWNNIGSLCTRTQPLSEGLPAGSFRGPAGWLTGPMEYIAKFNFAGGEMVGKAVVDPFSRQVPLLLESYLDEVLEGYWLDYVLGPSRK